MMVEPLYPGTVPGTKLSTRVLNQYILKTLSVDLPGTFIGAKFSTSTSLERYPGTVLNLVRPIIRGKIVENYQYGT
jgi:hypothetical protein